MSKPKQNSPHYSGEMDMMNAAHDALAAETEELKSRLFEAEDCVEQAQKNSEYDDWRYEQLRTENEQLKASLIIADSATGIMHMQTALQQLRDENERLKEVISCLPKIPTEPYEKEMAKEINELRTANAALVDRLSWVRDGIQHFTNEDDDGQRVYLTKAIDETLEKYGGSND